MGPTDLNRCNITLVFARAYRPGKIVLCVDLMDSTKKLRVVVDQDSRKVGTARRRSVELVVEESEQA